MTKSLIRRKLDVSFSLNNGGKFGESGTDTVTLTGLRVRADIQKAGGASLSTMNMAIYGLTFSKMNQLSTLGKTVVEARRNSVVVKAGDDTSGMSQVFAGDITHCWADFSAAPEVFLNVYSVTASFHSINAVEISSYKGNVDAAAIFADIGEQIGYKVENNDVSVPLQNVYLSGTAVEKLRDLAEMAHVSMLIDDTHVPPVIAIYPKDGTRTSLQSKIPLVSAETGMRGYPTYTSSGLRVQSLFNSAIVQGSTIEVKSSLKNVSGKWSVQILNLNLESETPNGQWFMTMDLSPPGITIVSATTTPVL